MSGKLYGIGVGPGDSGLLTLKAKQILDNSRIIACPVKEKGEESTALNIIKQVVDLSEKEIIEVIFRMDKDKAKREQCRRKAAELLAGYLSEGVDVAMITLGDVSVYSTYTYVNQIVKSMGYETEIIPGIPSFCSGAAMAEVSLVEGNESLGVISSLKGTQSLEDMLGKFDNLVVMKAGGHMAEIAAILKARKLLDKTVVLSNIGMMDAYIGPMDTDRDYGYFTTLIIKKGGL